MLFPYTLYELRLEVVITNFRAKINRTCIETYSNSNSIFSGSYIGRIVTNDVNILTSVVIHFG